MKKEVTTVFKWLFSDMSSWFQMMSTVTFILFFLYITVIESDCCVLKTGKKDMVPGKCFILF